MEARKIYGVLYILLLTMTVPVLCANLERDEDDHKIHRRYVVAPITVYAGAAVSPWVWALLVAAYGTRLLIQYAVRKTSSDNHSCAGNRGWCRSSCFSHEKIDTYYTPVCGNYYCCRPK